MREIEVKARIKNVDEVCKILESAGHDVSRAVTQHDQVYGLPGVDGVNDNHQPWLRLRTETNGDSIRYLFTLKKSITNQLDSIEHETEIANPNELLKIFIHMGYESYSDVTKSRRKSKIGDIELCIDSVDGLGEFIEAEKLTDDDVNYESVERELWDTLKLAGVSSTTKVTDGYDVLMRRALDA